MSLRLLFPLHAILFVLLLAGCRDESAHSRIQALEAKTTQLASDLENNRIVVKYLFDQRTTLKSAVLSPTEKGYQFLECNAGRLLVSCAGAEPYLDGHKVQLDLGNPLSMSFSGFKLNVRFGKRPPGVTPSPGAETWDTWQKGLKAQEIAFTELLRPGTWTKVEMILAPSKPEDLAYIELTLTTDQVQLVKPY